MVVLVVAIFVYNSLKCMLTPVEKGDASTGMNLIYLQKFFSWQKKILFVLMARWKSCYPI